MGVPQSLRTSKCRRWRSTPARSCRSDLVAVARQRAGTALARAAHPEHRAALGSGSVDLLLEHIQSDAPLTQIGAKRDQVQHRPPEPIQPSDHQDVASTKSLQHQNEFGP